MLTGGEVLHDLEVTCYSGHTFAEALLRIAHAFQQATDWHTRRPRLV